MIKYRFQSAGLTPFAGVLGLATLLASGCSSSGSSSQPCGDPNAQGTRIDGQCCTYSANCAVGSICNDPSQDLYDPSKPAVTIDGKKYPVCVKVTCSSSADCESGKSCSLEGVCTSPVCQADAECQGTRCISGSCQAAPAASTVMSCEVVTPPQSTVEKQTIDLVAIGKDASGKAVPAIAFDWSSSNPGAMSVSGAIGTAGSERGAAMITAKVSGTSVACSGGVAVTNFPQLAPGMSRVILVASGSGLPLSGAQITIQAGGVTTTTSAVDGSITLPTGAAIDAVTVTKAGMNSVTVLAPGTRDLLIPVPEISDPTRSAGFRGVLDLSKTRMADIQAGVAAAAIPNNFLDTDLVKLLGDMVPTTIDAPELGLNMKQIPLPGGVLLGLGAKHFTADTDQAGGGVRCEGTSPSAQQLGCFLTRAQPGANALWAIGGQVQLATVLPLAKQLSGVLGMSGGIGSLPIGQLLTAALPLVRGLNHAVIPAIDAQALPTVPSSGQVDCSNPAQPDYGSKCRGDYAKFQQVTLAADAKVSVFSAVQVPALPQLPGGGKCASTTLVVSAALLQGRGIVPLGIGAGLDTLNGEAPDCVVDGAPMPFGDNSMTLKNGQVPLSAVPPHGGIEGSHLALAAVAIDPASITSASFQATAIVKHLDRLGNVEDFGPATYLPFPTGTLSRTTGTLSMAGPLTGATTTRLTFENDGQRWIVYAPASMSTVTLPNLPGPRSVMNAASNTVIEGIQIGGADGKYVDLWTAGSGKTLDRFVENVSAFVVQPCSGAAGSACAVQR